MTDVNLRLKVYGILEDLTVGLRKNAAVSLPASAAAQAAQNEDKATVRVAGQKLEEIPPQPARDEDAVIANLAGNVSATNYADDFRAEESLYTQVVRIDELTRKISANSVNPEAASAELEDLITEYNEDAASVGGTALSSSPTTTEINNAYLEITHRAAAKIIELDSGADGISADVRDIRRQADIREAQLNEGTDDPESLANSIASRIINPANRSEALGAANAVKIDLLKTLL